jgi:cytochrome c2
VRWIVDPAALVPGTKMPSMGVSPDDAHAMAAYLLSLK